MSKTGKLFACGLGISLFAGGVGGLIVYYIPDTIGSIIAYLIVFGFALLVAPLIDTYLEEKKK